jgi:hypothetical protein
MYSQADIAERFDSYTGTTLLLKCVDNPDNLKDPLLTLKFLVEKMGADVNATDSDGRSALGAVFNMSILGTYLLSKGADMFAKDKDGFSALQLCVEYGEHWIIDSFESLGGESALITKAKEQLNADGTSRDEDLREYVESLIYAGYATKASNIIESGIVYIDPSSATNLFQKVQENFDNMRDAVNTYLLLERLGATM